MADQEKREYNLRRLHSLLGVIPIGLFLMQHLVVNHFSTYSEEAFNTAAGFMENLPLQDRLGIWVDLYPNSFPRNLWGVYRFGI